MENEQFQFHLTTRQDSIRQELSQHIQTIENNVNNKLEKKIDRWLFKWVISASFSFTLIIALASASAFIYILTQFNDYAHELRSISNQNTKLQVQLNNKQTPRT